MRRNQASPVLFLNEKKKKKKKDSTSDSETSDRNVICSGDLDTALKEI